jgi:acyl carrier protein
MSVTAAAQLDEIKRWLMARRPGTLDIDIDADLIESKLIDSMMFMELLLYIEEVIGHEINLDEQSQNWFRTLRSIRDSVLEQEPGRRERAS